MADISEMTPNEEFAERAVRLQSAGHDIVWERSTFRHRDFKKDLDPETPITVREGGERVPLLTNYGAAVTASMILPEKLDLAVDADGVLFSQEEFEKRYRAFIMVTLPDFCDLQNEPVPNASVWLLKIEDPFGESRGSVSIGFDANKPAENEVTHLYNPENDQLLERMATNQAEQGEALATAMKGVEALLEKATRGPGRPPKNKD